MASRCEAAVRWRAVESAGGAVHVLPVLDYVHHRMSPRCVCGPRVEMSMTAGGRRIGSMVVHASLDGREVKGEVAG